MDWDKIRIFFTVAEAGSFTRAGEDLGLSQSAVSRQISALERELRAPLFHRHARGLLLTEQGDLLFRAARDMKMRLETTRARLAETAERPSGDLKVTTTVGLGSLWLTQRLPEFFDLYPEIRVELILSNEELDLAMREADVAIRLRQPTQPDLIQRRLFTVHFHIYASTGYIKQFGEPKSLSDLDDHRLLAFGWRPPSYLLAVTGLSDRAAGRANPPRLHSDDQQHLSAEGGGRERPASPCADYCADFQNQLVSGAAQVEMPSLDSQLVYRGDATSRSFQGVSFTSCLRRGAALRPTGKTSRRRFCNPNGLSLQSRGRLRECSSSYALHRQGSHRVLHCKEASCGAYQQREGDGAARPPRRASISAVPLGGFQHSQSKLDKLSRPLPDRKRAFFFHGDEPHGCCFATHTSHETAAPLSCPRTAEATHSP